MTREPQPPVDAPSAPNCPQLTAVLLDFKREHQAAQALADLRDDHDSIAYLAKVEDLATEALKVIIAAHGWPGHTLTGEAGANAAWWIVHHSNDRAFQRRALALLDEAVQVGEATQEQLTFLTDRVRVLAGRPQLYGTQFNIGTNGLRAYVVEDPEHLDVRRAKMGLSPFDAFDKLVRGFYPPPDPPDSGSPTQRYTTRRSMHTIEYEAKALGIDPNAMAERIKAAGGSFQGERLMRRYVYDTVPAVPGRWVRLRDSGGAVTLCVKTISSDEIDGTRETETTVGSFEDTHVLLGLMGLAHRSYQENRRSSWLLDGVRLEIDEWPRIPPYLEIEGDTEDEVWSTAELLSIPRDDLTSENTTKVFARYGIDLDSINELRFA